MKRIEKRILSLLMALTLCVSAFAASIDDVRAYILRSVTQPQIAAVGGDWAVLGLARGEGGVTTAYREMYLASVRETVRAKGGVLNARRYTDYARVTLALSAVGADARSIAGYDLTKPLGDFENTVKQGFNGAIFALLALDSAAYPMPRDSSASIPATRQMYIGTILERQLADGGWALSGRTADADLTAMALQALAKYRAQKNVAQAVERGTARLSAMQRADGTYASGDVATAESCAQVILALCALDIAPDDARFVKNGVSVSDALLTFQDASGGFCHTKNGGVNQMASEQALLALTALERREAGKKTLYDMTDTLTIRAQTTAFSDTAGHRNRADIETLCALGAVNGRSGSRFEPDEGLTRAEFAAILVRAVGLVPKTDAAFDDVSGTDWFAPYVGAAHESGVVGGVSHDRFAPHAAITRQEAATMLLRAAKLCGLDTTVRGSASYTSAASWAREGVAWCVANGVLKANDLRPRDYVTRGEMAQMIVTLLRTAKMV